MAREDVVREKSVPETPAACRSDLGSHCQSDLSISFRTFSNDLSMAPNTTTMTVEPQHQIQLC